MAVSDTEHLVQMVRAHPVRTGIFTVGPVLFGLVQMANSYLNDGSLLFAALFLGVMATFASLVTRYHLSTFRISQLDEQFDRFE